MRQKSVRNQPVALNVKLLLILSIVGMTLVGGLGGAYFFLVLRNALQDLCEGVELESKPGSSRCPRNYGRVLGKEPRVQLFHCSAKGHSDDLAQFIC